MPLSLRYLAHSKWSTMKNSLSLIFFNFVVNRITQHEAGGYESYQGFLIFSSADHQFVDDVVVLEENRIV